MPLDFRGIAEAAGGCCRAKSLPVHHVRTGNMSLLAATRGGIDDVEC